MTLTDALTRNLALQILITRGHLPPSPTAAQHDVLLAAWMDHYRTAYATAQQMLAATDVSDEGVVL